VIVAIIVFVWVHKSASPLKPKAYAVLASTDAGRRLLAFAGIGRPEKFFATVEATRGVVVGRRPFPDHHPYSDAELDALIAEAARLDALPVTTAKDAVRIPAAKRENFAVLGVTLAWEQPAEIEALLTELLSAPRSPG
jgi:tetraacyldisaccharide 4'-kinase